MDNKQTKLEQLYLMRQSITDIHNYLIMQEIKLPENFNQDLYNFNCKLDYYIQDSPNITIDEWNALDINALLASTFFDKTITAHSLSPAQVEKLRKHEKKQRLNPLIKATLHNPKNLGAIRYEKSDTPRYEKSDTLRYSILNTISDYTPTPCDTLTQPPTTLTTHPSVTSDLEDYLTYENRVPDDSSSSDDSPPNWVTESIPQL